MPRYKFVGDSPRSIPALGIDAVKTGDIVDVPEEINNPDFELIKDSAKKAAAKEG